MGLVKYTMKELQELRTEMTKSELDEVFKRKAVWHHGPNGEETSAIWKAQDVKRSIKEAGNKLAPQVKFLYVTNTHRAMATSKTLEGAINKFHSFIKRTA